MRSIAARWSSGRKWSAALLAAFLGSVVILANLAPARALLPSRSFCWSVRLFGLECPGCGLTRSMLAVARGDLSAALELNWLGVALFGLLLLFLLNRFHEHERARTKIDVVLATILVVLMIARTAGFYFTR